MRWPALAKRRQVLLPTAMGWLLIAGLLSAGLARAWRGVFPFLAVQEPADASILVVEGWMDREGLDQAFELARQGDYARVVTTGGPIESWPERIGCASYAELAADYLLQLGLPPAQVSSFPAPASAQERTFLSAIEVRDRLRAEGADVRALDIFSWGCHARRTRLLYRLAFGPGVEIGIRSAASSRFGTSDWWRSSAGAKSVLQESIALLWTELFFWPPEPGSHAERWAVEAGAH